MDPSRFAASCPSRLDVTSQVLGGALDLTMSPLVGILTPGMRPRPLVRRRET